MVELCCVRKASAARRCVASGERVLDMASTRVFKSGVAMASCRKTGFQGGVGHSRSQEELKDLC